jgi:hypothetical protein
MPLFIVTDSHQKRYVASRGENVIGVVLAKAGDTFRVDIGTRQAIQEAITIECNLGSIRSSSALPFLWGKKPISVDDFLGSKTKSRFCFQIQCKSELYR